MRLATVGEMRGNNTATKSTNYENEGPWRRYTR